MQKNLLAKILLVISLSISGCFLYGKLDIHQGKASVEHSDLRMVLKSKEQWVSEGVPYGVMLGSAIAIALAPQNNWLSTLCVLSFGAIAGTLGNAAVSQGEHYVHSTPYRLNKGITMCGAVAQGDIELVRSMLARGESPFDVDPQGNNAFHYAAALGHASILKLLVDSIPNLKKEEKPEQLGETLTIKIVWENDKSRKAEKAKKDDKVRKTINGRNLKNRTAAMLAALCNNPEELKILVDAHADVGNLKDQFGQTVNDMVVDKPKLKEVIAQAQAQL